MRSLERHGSKDDQGNADDGERRARDRESPKTAKRFDQDNRGHGGQSHNSQIHGLENSSEQGGADRDLDQILPEMGHYDAAVSKAGERQDQACESEKSWLHSHR